MVVTNELAATIDESKSLVQFLDQSQQDVSDIGPRLQNMITRAKDLQATVKVMMNQVETDPEFLRRAVKELKDFEKPSPDAGSVNEKNSLGQHSHHSQQQLHQHSQQQEEDLGITPELGWDDQQAFKWSVVTCDHTTQFTSYFTLYVFVLSLVSTHYGLQAECTWLSIIELRIGVCNSYREFQLKFNPLSID